MGLSAGAREPGGKEIEEGYGGMHYLLQHWATVLTALVAIYGAVLSTWNLVSNLREKRRHVSVSVLVIDKMLPPATGPVVMLTAANPGFQPVELAGARIEVTRGRDLLLKSPVPEEGSFPHTLEGGKSFYVFADEKHIVETLLLDGVRGTVQLVGVFIDALKSTYKSKPVDFML